MRRVAKATSTTVTMCHVKRTMPRVNDGGPNGVLGMCSRVRLGRTQRPTSQCPSARAAQLTAAIVSSTFIPSSLTRWETYAPVWRTIRYRTYMRKAGQRPLTPDDWAEAALAAIARGGVDAVAVETVAAELGATKGSFYWHFKNRDALIQAALDLWEQRGTEAVIEEFEREPDPATRLKKI